MLLVAIALLPATFCYFPATFCFLVEGGAHLQDQRFQEWLDEYRDTITEQNLDPAEIYPNWLQNAEFVDEKFYQQKIQDKQPVESLNQDIPSSVDWRTKDGVVQPVISQGQYDNSESITIVESIESLRAIQKKEHFALSIVEVESCCKNYTDYYQCIVDIGGLASDDVYPQSTVCQSQKYKPVATIGGVSFVPRGNETALAAAVAKQPVVVNMDASKRSLQVYREGVYRDPSCSPDRLDHFMLVVGYGTYEGIDYWLCQNSWGSSWGMEGFIKIERNAKNMCGIASRASYPD